MLGKLKLGNSDQTDLKLFDEFDRTEYDDDECLALFDNEQVMLLCKNGHLSHRQMFRLLLVAYLLQC